MTLADSFAKKMTRNQVWDMCSFAKWLTVDYFNDKLTDLRCLLTVKIVVNFQRNTHAWVKSKDMKITIVMKMSNACAIHESGLLLNERLNKI